MMKVALLLLLAASCLTSKKSPWPKNFELPDELLLQKGTSDNSQICKTVWKNGNTLCNGDKLSSYAQKTRLEISKVISTIKSELQEIYKNSTTSTPSSRFLQINKKKKSIIGSSLSLNADMLLALSTVNLFSNEQRIAEFGSSAEACWSRLAKAREAATCHICAKSHAGYFHKRKAVVAEADCSGLLAECAKFFKLSSSFIQDTKDIVQDAGNGNWDHSKIGKVYNLMEKANLIQLIKEYTKTGQNADTKRKAGNNICARLFTVHKKPFFSAIYEITDAVVKKFRPIFAANLGLAKMGGRRILEYNNQLDNNAGDPFESDTVIHSSSDNMFTSYDGSKGTTEYANGCTPMNLTMAAFP